MDSGRVQYQFATDQQALDAEDDLARVLDRAVAQPDDARLQRGERRLAPPSHTLRLDGGGWTKSGRSPTISECLSPNVQSLTNPGFFLPTFSCKAAKVLFRVLRDSAAPLEQS